MPLRVDDRYGVLRMLLINTAIGLVPPVLYLLFSRRPSVEVFQASLVRSIIHANVIGAVATLTLMRTWHTLARLRPLPRWSATAAVLLVAAVGGSLLSVALVTGVGLRAPGGYWAGVRDTLKIALLITAVAGGGGAFFETMRARLEETTLALRTRELERERLEGLATRARLSSLESRIHPHFLFNSLNSISALIRIDPERAERLVERLSSLLRFALDTSADEHGAGLVSLGQEMKIVAGYLEIEGARFGARLRAELEVAAELHALAVPALAVQTLVENSVKHAVLPRREGGRIRVSARAPAPGRLEVAVWDDGPGFDAQTLPAGRGLDNLRARLAGLFGTAAALTIGRHDGGTTVTLELPARTTA